jgi:hypothetical protein
VSGTAAYMPATSGRIRPMREDEVDHREEQDQRWAKLTVLACPECGVEVLTLDVPIAIVWCAVSRNTAT